MTTNTMSVRFLRVLGVRCSGPGVLAIVDGHTVRWRRAGWSCTCPTEGDQCPHVDAVAALLDPRVTATNRRRASPP